MAMLKRGSKKLAMRDMNIRHVHYVVTTRDVRKEFWSYSHRPNKQFKMAAVKIVCAAIFVVVNTERLRF